MSRLGDFALAPVRALAVIGAAARLGGSMIYAKGRQWGLMLARTVIDYRREIGDPATNSIVGAVIGWLARNFPEAPVRVIRNKDPHDMVPLGPAGAGYFQILLERPNPYYSGALQWAATVVDFIVDGNAYWLKRRAGNPKTGRPFELWWVPARFMEPRWPEDDPSVFIDRYDITIDGQTYWVPRENVVHFRNGINPLNVRKGRSQLDSLTREIFTDNEASAFTASLLRNLGVPGVVLAPANTTGPHRTLEGDAEDIKERFMERTQGDKRGEPMVFTVPTDVKVLSFSPQAMDLKALRRIPEERIAAVLGVPAAAAQLGAGLDRSTFTNYGEANRAALHQGIMPLGRLLAAELEVQLLPDFVQGDALEILDVIFDYSATPAMAEIIAEIGKRHADWATRGLITRADFKRSIGHPVTNEDKVYIMANNYLMVPSEPDQPATPILPAPPAPRKVEVAPTAASNGHGGVLAPVAEARCGVCDKLLGSNIIGTIWCPRCKAPREFGAPLAAV